MPGARGRGGYDSARIRGLVGTRAALLVGSLCMCGAYLAFVAPAGVETIATEPPSPLADAPFVAEVVKPALRRKLTAADPDKIYFKGHDDDDVVWSDDNPTGYKTCKSTDQVGALLCSLAPPRPPRAHSALGVYWRETRLAFVRCRDGGGDRKPGEGFYVEKYRLAVAGDEEC